MKNLSDEQIVELVRICNEVSKAVELKWVPQGIPQRNLDSEIVRMFHGVLREKAEDIKRLGELCLTAGILALELKTPAPSMAAVAVEPLGAALRDIKSGVVQRLEHSTDNRKVDGSIPSPSTTSDWAKTGKIIDGKEYSVGFLKSIGELPKDAQ